MNLEKSNPNNSGTGWRVYINNTRLKEINICSLVKAVPLELIMPYYFKDVNVEGFA